jgi:hypothetical protein
MNITLLGQCPSGNQERKLCECGCGKEVGIYASLAKGLKGKHMRFIVGHSTRLSGVQYIVNEKTECWEWQMSKNRKGYGQIGLKMEKGFRTAIAHRVFYERMVGKIPEGLSLDHLCKNKSCVNPKHLEPVTNAENQRRASKLSVESIYEIRSLMSGKEKKEKIARELAEKYGVCQTMIYKIKHYQAWKNV